MTTRANLVRSLCDRIYGMKGRVIVAVDGVDGAGKTIFAGELASILTRMERPVIQASVDGFHHNRAFRYRRGKSDPQGFFKDSYNYDAFRDELITPFRAGESKVSIARFDYAKDQDVCVVAAAEPSTILLIDGIFLHREELADLWDFSIFLFVPFSVSYTRMAIRDGSNPEPQAIENRRYYEGQQIYLRNCRPEERASMVIDNSVIEAPSVMIGTRIR